MTLVEKKEDLLAALNDIRDGQERFAWLVARGKAQPPLDAGAKVEGNRVEGCLSRLWFVAEFRDGRCFFQADGDSMIVKSIAGLLCEFYSGSYPWEVLKVDPSFLGSVGIHQHLTPNRRNSLSKVWEKIHRFASDSISDFRMPNADFGRASAKEVTK